MIDLACLPPAEERVGRQDPGGQPGSQRRGPAGAAGRGAGVIKTGHMAEPLPLAAGDLDQDKHCPDYSAPPLHLEAQNRRLNSRL